MKCPECSYNQKVNRDGMTCVGCNYRFCFNPKVSGLTDGKFSACIRSASQNGTQWYTENQLYAAFCRRMSRPQYKYALMGLAPMALGFLILTETNGNSSFGLLLIAGGVVLSILVAIACHLMRPVVERLSFDGYLKQWKSHNKLGKSSKLLIEPSLKKPPPEWTEPDIYDYGVERILIVERNILVDLFVRNGFHAEQRMLVLAESGYPSYLAPIAAKLLEERADLPIFLLHDATAHGIGMEQRIRSGNLLPLHDHPLTDLGLFPADFKKLNRTNAYDSANVERDLPVDALMFPFLIMGMGSAFAHGETFSTLLAQESAYSSAGSGGSGGCGGGDGGGDFG